MKHMLLPCLPRKKSQITVTKTQADQNCWVWKTMISLKVLADHIFIDTLDVLENKQIEVKLK